MVISASGLVHTLLLLLVSLLLQVSPPKRVLREVPLGHLPQRATSPSYI